MVGVYQIICLATQRSYIGSSIDVEKRIAAHLSALRKNKHVNYDLQQEFTECGGEDLFIFRAICSPLRREDLRPLEQEIIAQYRFPLLYNIARVAGRTKAGRNRRRTWPSAKQIHNTRVKALRAVGRIHTIARLNKSASLNVETFRIARRVRLRAAI